MWNSGKNTKLGIQEIWIQRVALRLPESSWESWLTSLEPPILSRKITHSGFKDSNMMDENMLYKSESALCPKDDTAVSGTACLPACKVQAILNIATGVKLGQMTMSLPLLKPSDGSHFIMVKAPKASLSLFPPCTLPLWPHLLLLSPLFTLFQLYSPLLFLEHTRHTSP